jgi:hypothetical protein
MNQRKINVETTHKLAMDYLEESLRLEQDSSFIDKQIDVSNDGTSLDRDPLPAGITSPACTKETGIAISDYLPKENKFAIGGIYRALEKGDIIVAIYNDYGPYQFSDQVTNSDKFTSSSKYSDSLRSSGIVVNFYKTTESMMGECMKNPELHGTIDN